jgi:hypothetical protein
VSSTTYCIELKDKVGVFYQYARKENIQELAQFLNTLVKEFPYQTVISVSLYDEKTLTLGKKLLTAWEFKNQLFLEDYSDRLLMARSMDLKASSRLPAVIK